MIVEKNAAHLPQLKNQPEQITLALNSIS